MTLQLEDLSLLTRLGILVMTILATIFMLIIVLSFEAEGQQKVQHHFTEYAEQLIYLDREAINLAYVEHVKKLYGVWVLDYNAAEATPKQLKSMDHARHAYARAMREIDRREREFEATKGAKP